MTIELKPLNTISAGPTAVQVKLSPDVEQLLAALKVSVGEKMEALITKISLISVDQRIELSQTKNQSGSASTKQLWQTILTEPALKLVELKHQQTLFTAITGLAVQKGETLMVTVTARGLQIISPPLTETKPSQLPTSNPLANTATATHSIAASTAQHLPAPNVNLGGAITSATAPLAQSAQATPPIPSALGGASPTGGEIKIGPMIEARASVAPTAAQTERTSQIQNSSRVLPSLPLPTGQMHEPTRAVLTQAMANVLPIAQSVPPLLAPAARLNSLLQLVPAQSLPPTLKPLMALLTQLQAPILNLNSTQALAPGLIAKAIRNNGIFYEHNAFHAAVQEPKSLALTADEDLKALLIKTIITLGQTPPTATTSPEARPTNNDAVARLWLGLLGSFAGKELPTKLGVSRQENLLQQVQALAHHALAKIQLNQYRSIPHGLSDSGSANQPLHLDVPIKWPDFMSNAYLQIFPPKIADDETAKGEAKQKRLKQARWRLFMELDLGDEGYLAVELTLADKQLDAMFWAEKDALRQKAAAHLQHLRSELSQRGLEVTDLRCSGQPPPAQKMNLDYALIDIQT